MLNWDRLYTSPVGSFTANGYGLYDMVGNLREWCWDSSRSYGSSPVVNPHGLPGAASGRSFRGCFWDYDTLHHCRVAFRCIEIPEYYSNWQGFRLVRG